MDGDGQPTHLIVQPSDGAHVAQADADWLWLLIRAAAVTGDLPAEAAEDQLRRRLLAYAEGGVKHGLDGSGGSR